MLDHEHISHVTDHIIRDLSARYDQLPPERVERIVRAVQARLEPGNHHPEFLGAIIEHQAKAEVAQVLDGTHATSAAPHTGG